MPNRIAYIPLDTHPEAAPDAAVLAATGWAKALGCGIHVATFAVDIPPASVPGGALIGAEGMARAIEERSRKECDRLRALIEGTGADAMVTTRTVPFGSAADRLAEARHFDLSILPWQPGSASGADLAQALVFGSGRPVILVPPLATAAMPSHIALAWDGSRVAARALGDALALIAPEARVTVLTVEQPGKSGGADLAGGLAAALARRGYPAEAVTLPSGPGSVAAALQEAARSRGAELLVMGGFGHSRLRDFILGGVTQGIFAELDMPVLLSH
jgi:nucleotide-binding universal stress UspA family protein